MAIHFHSGQLSAVCDLVCTTLGMRLALRPASTARMKVAFTQDIFPEQVMSLSSLSNLSFKFVYSYVGCHCPCRTRTSHSWLKRGHSRFSACSLYIPADQEQGVHEAPCPHQKLDLPSDLRQSSSCSPTTTEPGRGLRKLHLNIHAKQSAAEPNGGDDHGTDARSDN